MVSCGLTSQQSTQTSTEGRLRTTPEESDSRSGSHPSAV